MNEIAVKNLCRTLVPEKDTTELDVPMASLVQLEILQTVSHFAYNSDQPTFWEDFLLFAIFF